MRNFLKETEAELYNRDIYPQDVGSITYIDSEGKGKTITWKQFVDVASKLDYDPTSLAPVINASIRINAKDGSWYMTRKAQPWESEEHWWLTQYTEVENVPVYDLVDKRFDPKKYTQKQMDAYFIITDK